MLFLLSLLLFLAGAFLILLLPALWGEQIFHEYRDARTVDCPETHAPVSVRFNAMKAAWRPCLDLHRCGFPIARAGPSALTAARNVYLMRSAPTAKLRRFMRPSMLPGIRAELCTCRYSWRRPRRGCWGWPGIPNTCFGRNG